MKIKNIILAVISITTFVACYKTPEYPIEPTVQFVSFDKPNDVYTLDAGEGGNLVLSFTDGDGDLGKLNNEDSSSTVVYRNLRDTAFFGVREYVIPVIPKKGTTDAISGKIEIKLNDALFNSYATYFILKGISVDTFTYQIYLKDRAGHSSNVITTPSIVVKI
ncbi:MAG: hypothetical protein R2739_07440 [Chitinophagales bacterium]|nr:hypothetical protein [Bacteroidota bacterium]